MPNFGKESLMKLAECHPELQILFHEVIHYFDCVILVGHRGQADQEAAFASGKTQLHYPMGNHNKIPSMAVDAMPYPLDWNDRDEIHYFAGYVMATAAQLYKQGIMSYKLRWGGNWKKDNDLKDNHFSDFDHFELVKE